MHDTENKKGPWSARVQKQGAKPQRAQKQGANFENVFKDTNICSTALKKKSTPIYSALYRDKLLLEG
jgi:hypothetical protein